MSLCFYFFPFFFLPPRSRVCSLLVLSALFHTQLSPSCSPGWMELCGVSLGRWGLWSPGSICFPGLSGTHVPALTFYTNLFISSEYSTAKAVPRKGSPWVVGEGVTGRGDGKPFGVDCVLAGCYGLCWAGGNLLLIRAFRVEASGPGCAQGEPWGG